MIRALFFVFLVPAVAFAAEASGPEPSVLVKTAALKKESIGDSLTAYGSVESQTAALVNLSFPQPGQVSAVQVVVGQRVRRGRVLIELATDPGAMAIYQQARTTVDFAQGELRRMEELAAHHLATNSQVESARKNFADAQALWMAQKKLGAEHKIATLKAPFDAVVTALHVQPGDRVAAGTFLLQLAKVGALRIRLGVEPEDITRIKIGMPVRVTSVFGNSVVNAKVDQIHGVVNPQTRLVDVMARFVTTNIDGLMPGMQVRGVITLAAQQAWVVPRSAVLQDAKGAYIYQVTGGYAHRLAVQAGVETPQSISVMGALDPNLQVVVLGNYELNDGMAVRVSTK